MNIKDCSEALKAVSYLYGYLASYKDDGADAILANLSKILQAEMDKRLSFVAKLEMALTPKPEDKPAPVPEQIQTDCPTMPVQPIKPKPIEEIELTDKDIASRRKECQKCLYFAGETQTCDYNHMTGKVREAPVSECELWRGSERKNGRMYRRVCRVCGKAFQAPGPRTKLCPECKEVYA